MKLFRRILIVLASGFIASLISQSGAHATSYAVGDTGPAGGKIFITPSTAGNSTGKYFEVAPLDVSSSRYTFCNNTKQLISGTLHDEIGAGSTNTQAMIDWGCTTGAAVAARNYTLGGYSDWFLPSLNEAAQLFASKSATGFFDGSPALDGLDTHWTSTGYDATTSWTRYFTSNVVYSLDQTSGGGFFVRAVRSFTPTKTASELADEDAAAQKKAAAERAARIQSARLKLQQLLENKTLISEQNLLEADIPLTRPESIVAAYNELIAFQKSQLTPLGEPEKTRKKYSVIMKYVTIEKITGENPLNTYARELVAYGLLDVSTPQKTRIVSALAKISRPDRDSMEKVNAFIALEVKAVNDRTERLMKRLGQHT